MCSPGAIKVTAFVHVSIDQPERSVFRNLIHIKKALSITLGLPDQLAITVIDEDSGVFKRAVITDEELYHLRRNRRGIPLPVLLVVSVGVAAARRSTASRQHCRQRNS